MTSFIFIDILVLFHLIFVSPLAMLAHAVYVYSPTHETSGKKKKLKKISGGSKFQCSQSDHSWGKTNAFESPKEKSFSQLDGDKSVTKQV